MTRQRRPAARPAPTRDADAQAARLEAATADARQVLAELNSAGKDLRNTLKETRDLLSGSSWAGEVRVQQATLAEHLEALMKQSSAKIIAEFDRLGATLLAVDRGEPIEDLVRQVAAHPGQKRLEPFPARATYDVDVLDVR